MLSTQGRAVKLGNAMCCLHTSSSSLMHATCSNPHKHHPCYKRFRGIYYGYQSNSFMMKGLLVILVIIYCCVEAEGNGSMEADRVVSLPGQPTGVNFSMFAGYVTVDENHGRAQFYYFVEAVEEPEDKPLVIWLTGGPGCSSITFGFAALIGPFFINPGGETLRLNPNAANKVANMLFIESPPGVGFSYSNRSSDLLTNGDNRTAYDNYAFVVKWLERFPQYKGRPFYLTGESYAGYYIPQLAKLIYENNENLPEDDKINLEGFMVGNPTIESYFDNLGRAEYLYYHALITDELYARSKQVCNFTVRENWTLSDACIQLVVAAAVKYGLSDAYSIYAPICLHPNTTSETTNYTQLDLVRGEAYDPCTYYYSITYFNRPDVQRAIHANTTAIPYPWTGCSETLAANWQNTTTTVIPIYEELLAAGLRLWVFSGDADSIVPVTGSRYALASLELLVVVPWYSWYNNGEVGGREIMYEGNLTLVTVRGAGHY